MLACITLDILASQASSVPCEWVFSGTKQVATDTSAWNAAQVEEVSIIDFEQMLVDDTDGVEWTRMKQWAGICGVMISSSWFESLLTGYLYIHLIKIRLLVWVFYT